MKGVRVFVVLFPIALVATLIFGLLFASRNHEVHNLKQRNSYLIAKNSSLQKQFASLSGKLNEANSTINQLSTSGSFVDGAACQSQQLSLEQAKNLGGAAGHRGIVLDFKNTSKNNCTLSGYPGLLALDSSGYVVPNGPIKTGNNYMFLNPSAKSVSIAPGESGYFAIGWGIATAPTGCITPSLIESTPPYNIYPLVISVNSWGDFCNESLSISTFDKNLSDF